MHECTYHFFSFLSFFLSQTHSYSFHTLHVSFTLSLSLSALALMEILILTTLFCFRSSSVLFIVLFIQALSLLLLSASLPPPVRVPPLKLLSLIWILLLSPALALFHCWTKHWLSGHIFMFSLRRDTEYRPVTERERENKIHDALPFIF